ncbi:MAG TPA: DUF4440 domain-containing protein [Firmicutes bacterium]|nr:DUF4440 domain-containing protein [Bacillota bacterium]
MDDISLAQCLLLLEERLLERSVKDFKTLLADDFVEFGSSGRIWSKQQAIDGIVDGSGLQATIVDFKTKRLAPDVVLTTFRLVNDRDGNQSLRSSIWKRKQDRWQMVFHQGTPTEAPRAATEAPGIGVGLASPRRA